VRFVTLGDPLRGEAVDHVDMLKIDAEGSEYRIIRGATDDTLERIERVSMELHVVPEEDNVVGDIVERLVEAGFRVTVKQTDPLLGMLWAKRG